MDESPGGRWSPSDRFPLLPAGDDEIERSSVTRKRKPIVVGKKSHDGACTVRGKVTLIIHDQPRTLVSNI